MVSNLLRLPVVLDDHRRHLGRTLNRSLNPVQVDHAGVKHVDIDVEPFQFRFQRREHRVDRRELCHWSLLESRPTVEAGIPESARSDELSRMGQGVRDLRGAMS